MNLQKIFLMKWVILILTLFILNPGLSQVKREEISSFSGVTESISNDFKLIVINEIRIFITANTKIVDEKGNTLKINDLKPKIYVAIEALRKPNGLFENKIVVKKERGV
jgi:hypothetical protein